jgi:hypothetical protein
MEPTLRDLEVIVDLVSAMGWLPIAIAILVAVLMLQGPLTESLRTASTVTVGPFELEREIGKSADQSRRLLKDRSKLQLRIAQWRGIEVEVFLSCPLLSHERRMAPSSAPSGQLLRKRGRVAAARSESWAT